MVGFKYNYPQAARDAGFKLRQYNHGPLDWRVIGSFEIERILREQNFEQIDSAIEHISEVPLGAILETNILDSGISKYFMISQFSIQYLNFCRKFLEEALMELRESHATSQMEVVTLRKSIAEANNEILQLHRKITEMEALHEVVYPCQLCTKNFVSNDALNIHIGRKHGINIAGLEETTVKGSETATNIQKVREQHDFSIINAIKLELEIKHLKERLNNAEKEIRERYTSDVNIKTSSQTEEIESNLKERKKLTKDIAIQNNLIEEKERDDYESEQTCIDQADKNNDSIAQINQKLGVIAQILNESANITTLDHENMGLMSEGKMLPSVAYLERVLIEKVTEIGQLSTEKLEALFYQLKNSHEQKSSILKDEIKNNLETQNVSEQSQEVTATTTNNQEEEEEEVAISFIKAGEENTYTKNYNVSLEELNKSLSSSSSSSSGHIKSSENGQRKIGRELTFKNTEGNTLDKTAETTIRNKATKIQYPVQHDSSTNVSENSSEEAYYTKGGETVKLQTSNIIKPENARLKVEKEVNKINNSRRVPASAAKYFTLQDAKELAEKQLSLIGFDITTQSISSANQKKGLSLIIKKRNKLKKKYGNYPNIRNKVRDLVDKLCSKNLPENAGILLETIQQLQTVKSVEATSLEHDIRAPRARASSSRASLVQVSEMQSHILDNPVPMPRKRVMFNTQDRANHDPIN